VISLQSRSYDVNRRSRHAAKEDVLEDFPPSDDEFSSTEEASTTGGSSGDIELRTAGSSSSYHSSDNNVRVVQAFPLKAYPVGTATLPPMSPLTKTSGHNNSKGSTTSSKKPKAERSLYSAIVNPLSGATGIDDSEGDGDGYESNDRGDNPTGGDHRGSPGLSLDRPPSSGPADKESNAGNQPPSMWL